MPRRTKAEVQRLRETPGGCCERYCDNMRCDCMQEAGQMTTDRMKNCPTCQGMSSPLLTSPGYCSVCKGEGYIPIGQVLNFPTDRETVEEQEAKLGPIPPAKGSVTPLGPLSDDLPALDHDPAGLQAMQDFKIRDRPHNPGE